MARRQPNKALGLDPLDDIAADEIAALIREEAHAETEAKPETEMEVEPVTDAKPAVTSAQSQAAETARVPLPTSLVEEGDDEMGTAVAESDEEDSKRLDELIAAIDQEVGHAFAPETETGKDIAAPIAIQDKEQHVIFSLAGAEYAVPIANVIEIGRPLNVTPLPNVPDWALGVANLRGEVISMIDLREFLGMGRTSYGQASRMLVARASEEDVTTSLIVDRVSGIRYLSVDEIVAPGAPIEDKIAPYLRGVCEHDGHLLVVLNLERLLLSPEMQQFEPV